VSAQRATPELLADVRRALKAEIGARSIYARLAPRMRDRELGQLLERFHDDEEEIVAGVRALLVDLGARRAPNASPSRALAGWILAGVSGGRSSSLALRLCLESESTVARWHAENALRLAGTGDLDRARACDGFAQIKLRHARMLEAWVRR
jgi:hypothetical protein